MSTVQDTCTVYECITDFITSEPPTHCALLSVNGAPVLRIRHPEIFYITYSVQDLDYAQG